MTPRSLLRHGKQLIGIDDVVQCRVFTWRKKGPWFHFTTRLLVRLLLIFHILPALSSFSR